MNQDPKLINSILADFQSVLIENLNFAWDENHGKPPKVAYVAMTSDSKKWWSADTASAAWKIAPESLIDMPIETFKKFKPAKNGMFYDICIGSFQVDIAAKTVWINWQTGPRFGRGYHCAIGHDENGSFMLGTKVRDWIS